MLEIFLVYFTESGLCTLFININIVFLCSFIFLNFSGSARDTDRHGEGGAQGSVF